VLSDEQGSRRHRHDRHHAGLQDLIEGRTWRLLGAIGKPTQGEPHDKSVHSAPTNCPTTLDMGADDGQALSKAAPNAANRKTELLGDLAIREAAEVGKFDYLLVLGWQLIHRFVNRLPRHGAREVDGP